MAEDLEPRTPHQETFQEKAGILKRFKGKMEALKVQKEKNDLGCVIRAIESAFGAKATEREWKKRLEDFRKIRNAPNPFVPGLSEAEQLSRIRYTQTLDTQSVRSLIELACKEQTPLGQKMSEYNAVEDTLTGEQIRFTLQEGKTILMSLTTTQRQAHLAHIGLNEGRVVSVSDGNVDTHISLALRYRVFVFTPRQMSNSHEG